MVVVFGTVFIFVGAFITGMLFKHHIRLLSRTGVFFVAMIGFCLTMGQWMVIGSYFDQVKGGSAGIGKVVGHKYFLGSHGKYTEVTYSVWQSSYYHERVSQYLIVLFILMMFACFITHSPSWREWLRRMSLGEQSPPHRDESGARPSVSIDNTLGKPQQPARTGGHSHSIRSRWHVCWTLLAIVIGGGLAHCIYSITGASIFWYLPVAALAAAAFSVVCGKCRGGRGASAWLIGVARVGMALAGIIASAVFAHIFYLSIFAFLADASLGLVFTMGVAFLGVLSIEFRFVGKCVIAMMQRGELSEETTSETPGR